MKKKITHFSSCCGEPIMVKGQPEGGLYCSKCGKENFCTIIVETTAKTAPPPKLKNYEKIRK